MDDRIHIRYRISVQNPSNLPVEDVHVRVRIPLMETSFQRRTGLGSEPAAFQDNTSGNPDMLVFHWELFPPHTTRMVTVGADLDIWEVPLKMPHENPERFLKAEPLLESDHPEVKALAASLKGETQLQTVKNIFSWVSHNLVYEGYVRENRGALYGLLHKTGDCTEFAALFVALCRASGIPARMMGGYVSPEGGLLDLGDYHNWAMFYHGGYWRVADPQKKRLMEEEGSYIAFLTVTPSVSGERAVVAGLEGSGMRVGLNR
ncbi:transglutaminase-like domain-containing protein [Desulfobotulus alkaliphilus]|uniref:transglutaminase-like domain-containing protein n=1 Tax=Desulfobotulus alkaliphilus TaxID=622671 RepID=UPI0016496722|nr:transglutaminase-like domain-containing protein [Desulfobotulus alkaliphilus]